LKLGSIFSALVRNSAGKTIDITFFISAIDWDLPQKLEEFESEEYLIAYFPKAGKGKISVDKG